jgi:ABC-type sugar transport system permease subunit
VTELAVPVAPRRRTSGWGALPWIAPAAAVLLFVFVYAMVQLVTESFQYKNEWTGWDNFAIVLDDPLFRTALKHNLQLLVCVPILIALALLLAVVLSETVRGLTWFRGMLFFPYVLPVTVVGVVLGQLLTLNGAINVALDSIGLTALSQDWLGDPALALWTMAGVIVWKEVGFGVILFLARILSLPTETYEAAALDGAGFWRRHWSITLPQMKGVIAFYAVTEAIVMVSWVFNYVYIMTNGQGGPGDSTVVTELYIFRSAFADSAIELAAAASVMLFLVTLVLVVIFFRIQRRSLLAVVGE